jgi:diadenosine tetraphosphate (Ap4A) HIT family hydrolase
MFESLKEAQSAGAAPWANEQIEWEDFHVVVFRDKFPVTNGHLLFVPTQNTPGLIREAFTSAMHTGDSMVKEGRCEGYNIGINVGRAAGQTVMYPHIHLIPRVQGDCKDPVGGVRGVIPMQQNYHSSSYCIPECDTIDK